MADLHFTAQCIAARYPMRKTAILCLVALIGASSACKKKLPASDAVRADLKNYLTVEMPKHQELLHLLTSVSEKFKDADGENKGPREKSDDENKLLTDAVTALKNTKIATDELKRVHSELEQGVEKMQTAFVKIAVVEKQSGAASSVAGNF